MGVSFGRARTSSAGRRIPWAPQGAVKRGGGAGKGVQAGRRGRPGWRSRATDGRFALAHELTPGMNRPGPRSRGLASTKRSPGWRERWEDPRRRSSRRRSQPVRSLRGARRAGAVAVPRRSAGLGEPPGASVGLTLVPLRTWSLCCCSIPLGCWRSSSGGEAVKGQGPDRRARRYRTNDARNRPRPVVTTKTIETHLGHIYQKLDIHSRTQLTAVLGPPP